MHNVAVYTLSADASPREKFETGVRCLDIGMTRRARQLINEAVADGYGSTRVFFYWLLSLVSGRALHELSQEEAAMLRNPPSVLRLAGDDAWADGVKIIRRLLDSVERPESDIRVLLKEFDALPEAQRAMILRHMDLFLKGQLEDDMWRRALQQAQAQRMAGDREKRVWKFFQPEPAPPGRREPQPVSVPATTWGQAVVATAVSIAAAAHIGYLFAQQSRFSAFLACVLSITGGYFGMRHGAEWRFRTVRRYAKDRAYGAFQASGVSPDRLAKRVGHRLDYYFATYVPDGIDRDAWLDMTAGIRRSIRDELADIYRDRGVSVERIAWLIRYRATAVVKRFRNGTLWNYRAELATPGLVKAAALLGCTALAGGGAWAAGGAIPAASLTAIPATALALACGWSAARAWLRIVLEYRRYAADEAESERVLQEDMQQFARWREVLADKPEDQEMAAWLDCDRKVLLNEALQHYKLTMSNVVAHAFIEAPAASTQRARVRGGPWRYKKYRLLVFLLTNDGVRQLAVTLDFERGTFHDRRRTNYRFEAVAAVQVRQGDDGERTFELALVDGQKISVQVMNSEAEELQQGESPGTVSEATLDAAGIHHTLHVLEGIAAEGKEWIRRYERARISEPHGHHPEPGT